MRHIRITDCNSTHRGSYEKLTGFSVLLLLSLFLRVGGDAVLRSKLTVFLNQRESKIFELRTLLLERRFRQNGSAPVTGE